MEQFYMEEKDGLKTVKCRAFDGIPWLRHGFSTRHGGVSLGECASLSFSYQKEAEELVDENFRRFCNANAMPFESLVLTHQTHTANVAIVNNSYRNRGRDRTLRETDGVVTAAKDLGLVCFTADCVPLLLVDPQAKVIAAVHAGWRGTVQSIAANAVKAMVQAGADPKNILAAIGPSIGPCHFEVGQEVAAEFAARFGEKLPLREHRGDHFMVDLGLANRLVLLEAGVPNDRIFTANICTYCNNFDFYSHRYTNGRRGSLIAAIAMEGDV